MIPERFGPLPESSMSTQQPLRQLPNYSGSLLAFSVSKPGSVLMKVVMKVGRISERSSELWRCLSHGDETLLISLANTHSIVMVNIAYLYHQFAYFKVLIHIVSPDFPNLSYPLQGRRIFPVRRQNPCGFIATKHRVVLDFTHAMGCGSGASRWRQVMRIKFGERAVQLEISQSTRREDGRCVEVQGQYLTALPGIAFLEVPKEAYEFSRLIYTMSIATTTLVFPYSHLP